MTNAQACERVLPFTEDDWNAIAEYLRVAQMSLLELATQVERTTGNPSGERMRVYAEQAADLRERIEAR